MTLIISFLVFKFHIKRCTFESKLCRKKSYIKRLTGVKAYKQQIQQILPELTNAEMK